LPQATAEPAARHTVDKPWLRKTARPSPRQKLKSVRARRENGEVFISFWIGLARRRKVMRRTAIRKGRSVLASRTYSRGPGHPLTRAHGGRPESKGQAGSTGWCSHIYVINQVIKMVLGFQVLPWKRLEKQVCV
jgi:hypothetical protein